ncbi:hypothetical protein FA95DRAFT_1453039, partial [Auriscalpium vulgare]
LDLMLRWCYPVASPPLAELEDIRLLLETTRKYSISVPNGAVVHALKDTVHRDPLGVFCISVLYSLEDMAAAAA